MGQLGEAASLAVAALSIDPLRESGHRLLIEIHLRDGNRQDALRQYHRFARELSMTGTRPGPTLTALVTMAFGAEVPHL